MRVQASWHCPSRIAHIAGSPGGAYTGGAGRADALLSSMPALRGERTVSPRAGHSRAEKRAPRLLPFELDAIALVARRALRGGPPGTTTTSQSGAGRAERVRLSERRARALA